MPPATTGAGPFIDPPFALTPLTVANSRLVSNLQTIAPSLVEYARTVTVLHAGKVLSEGSVAQVQADPRVQEVYLGTAQDDRHAEAVESIAGEG